MHACSCYEWETIDIMTIIVIVELLYIPDMMHAQMATDVLLYHKLFDYRD